ncbi:FAD-linked oxidase C-terminal domain-containing protein [Actinomycetaceae bacterium MB13-C1-2]|nr:FAD-linked oxidase C-terminal domain-containing protein [Actinomycetaceae bacterium MB13-C1-2]
METGAEKTRSTALLSSDSELYRQLSDVVEVDDSSRRRAEYSSDASNYRVPPRMVAFPRSQDEVIGALEVARELAVPITSRGAGTSVAGNAVGPGVIIDFSRYMNRVLDIDSSSGLARLEPGVILSDLQNAAAPEGLWFGPDPSTKNRATLGGMIGNNACGPHALKYGKTSDNVVRADVVDGLGRRFMAGAGKSQLDLIPGLSQLVSQNLALFRTELGRFGRQVSGYSLEHLLPERGTDLAKTLVGTEGTCVTLLEATVNLHPIPGARILVVLGYSDMVAAAEAVTALLLFNPLAIEGMDSRLVEVVRRHNDSVPDLPRGRGWLFCEVGPSPDDENADEGVQVRSALRAADELVAASGALDHRVVQSAEQAAALWRIRADGVGLAGRTPDGNQAWPGWEDAAVPPENLGPYLRDFDALMDQYSLTGLPYGHFGDGCIHVRIDLPLEEQDDVPRFRSFMEDAARLVGSYGGSLSGEHGDGRARGALLPHMYSDEAIRVFEQFKGLFDPQNLLNPGVLVDPEPITNSLRRPGAKPIRAKGFSFTEDGGDFTNAVHRCVGVGKCRADNFGIGDFMCPSYQATKDEKDVTRGRSRVLQDMARGAFGRTWDAPEVEQALDLCLSCKACGTDCPAGVDMSMYKSEVLYQKYSGRIRPMNHYVLGQLPRWSSLVTAVPPIAQVANWAMGVSPIRKAVFWVSGLDSRRQMTGFTTQRFSRWFRRRKTSAAVATKRDVILWADSFSEYLDPTAARDMVDLLQEAGYQVRIPSSDACCGLTWISTGQLDGAKRRLLKTLDVLGPAAEKGVAIIGVEPSCTAVLRSDLVELLPDDPRSHAVASMTMTLAELLTDPELGPEPEWFDDHRLDGTQIIAQPHCHQHAVMGYDKDMALLEGLGAEVKALAGCCGLAGNFGMEKGHYEISVAVAENQLLPSLGNATAGSIYLADGYSCRTQAEQLASVKGTALPSLLLRAGRMETDLIP